MSVLVVVAILRTGGLAYANEPRVSMHTAMIVMKSKKRLLLFMGKPLLKRYIGAKSFFGTLKNRRASILISLMAKYIAPFPQWETDPFPDPP